MGFFLVIEFQLTKNLKFRSLHREADKPKVPEVQLKVTFPYALHHFICLFLSSCIIVIIEWQFLQFVEGHVCFISLNEKPEKPSFPKCALSSDFALF